VRCVERESAPEFRIGELIVELILILITPSNFQANAVLHFAVYVDVRDALEDAVTRDGREHVDSEQM
jgi:hypothetical protein